MTWTYAGDPSASNLAAVRFKIGDTDTTDQILSDEEINYVLSANSDSILATSLTCCYNIAAKYARKVDNKLDVLSINASQKHKHYLALAQIIEKEISYSATPYCGGISVSDNELYEDDTDLVTPKFDIGMMDNNG